jgi:hypothetical protein
MKASWVSLVLTLLHSLLREEGEIGGNCSMGLVAKHGKGSTHILWSSILNYTLIRRTLLLFVRVGV